MTKLFSVPRPWYQSREEIGQLLLEFNGAKCFAHLTKAERSVVLREVIASDVFDLDNDLWPAREYCDEHAQELTDRLSDALCARVRPTAQHSQCPPHESKLVGRNFDRQAIAYHALAQLLVDTVLDNLIDKIDAVFAEVHGD
jgi:hypothetical protein